jgi:hypothetical protein
VSSTVHVVHAFLGLEGYYCRFIKDYGAIKAPLTKLLRKGSFHWTLEAADTFRALQRTLTSAPVLKLPAFDEEFIVECNTSGSGIDAVLHQGRGPVAFFSRPIAPRHVNFTAYECELIRLVQAVRH